MKVTMIIRIMMMDPMMVIVLMDYMIVFLRIQFTMMSKMTTMMRNFMH